MFTKLRTLGVVLPLVAGMASANAAVPSASQPDVAHPLLAMRSTVATAAPSGYSPTQVRHAYGMDQLKSTGAGAVIGIVDAYDDPTAAKDMAKFISTFNAGQMYGLPGTQSCTVQAGPHPCFQKVFAQGKASVDSLWAVEETLDVQWAHAVAPGADILLVESSSANTAPLLAAVDVAVKDGASTVSMSWGEGESKHDPSTASHFNHSGVAFFAASGDNGHGLIYPSSMPNIIAVGGTSLPLDGSGHLRGTETAWDGSGGGISRIQAEPGYQTSFHIPNTNGKRGVPDVSYNADPSTAVAIYDSTPYQGQSGWFAVGGTSAGSPQWAAVVALADDGRSGGPLATNSLTKSFIYDSAASSVYAQNYRDIKSGSNGSCNVCTAKVGYDFVTGLGSPLTNALVPYLQSH